MNGQVFNTTNNITFMCNATDEEQILNLSLYHNLNGSFSRNQSQNYGELPYDSSTTFLCNFNGGLACQGGGSANPVANNSLSFQDGKFSQGVLINETGLLRYQTSGNFDRNQGTIEFWIRPGSDITTETWYVFDAADNGAPRQNEMEIYTEGTVLYFIIYDSSGTKNYYAYADVSYWHGGNWYHVAAAWNLSKDACDDVPMELYVNGSSEGTTYAYDYDCDPAISYTSSSSSFSIGSDKYNQSQINATIDDFRISTIVRNASEINESYQDGLANYSSVSKSWTFCSVPDGSYIWSCLAYDNDSQSNQSSQRSFYVDISTPPSVNEIFLSPNSTDDIDPGVTINFTANISDPSGVDTAIFQWKEAEEENWNNITMSYNVSSGLYENATFQTIPNDMSVYYYRIWSNDTKGSSGYSPTQNVTSAVDFTWTRSPASFGIVQGMISTTGNVGILTINNTGDRTLNFTLSDNWPLYYNGSDNSNFYVTNHTAITINITADFASSDSENDITIIINASHYSNPPSLSPVSLTTNATINSFTGGPHLTVSITEYTSMVSQSQTFNLSTKVKNIGNETAEGVWLNWTLPQGWSNTSGNITYFAGNISPGSFAWNNLTVTVNPSSASPGTFIIYATSVCSQNETGCQNTTGYDSKTVGVSCSNSDGVCGYGCSYVNDNDCGIPTGAPGAPETVFVGGGGGEEIKYIMRMEAPSSLDIQRGDKKTLKVKITNDGKKTNITGISISIAGYPLTHVRISPPAISSLGYNQTGLFELEFFAPNYTRYGMHNLTLTARGTGSTIATRNLTSVENSGIVTLVVHSVHENETKTLLEEAEKAVQEMLDSGFKADKAKSLLEQARSQLSQWDYDSSFESSKSILELKEKSFHISGLIKQAEEGIKDAESYGIQTPESRKMSELSKSALEREDYAKAEERANNALVSYMIESRGIETMKFLYSYWWLILAVSGSSALAAYLAYRRALKGILKGRIEDLSKEEKAVRKLLEKTQEERYKERTLSDSEYHKLMSEHESELAKIKRKKHRLVSKLISVEKPSAALKDFRKQEESLRSEIQDIQKKYYEQGGLAKSSYQKSVDELREELAESIHRIEMIERRRNPGTNDRLQSNVLENRRKGQAGFLTIGILIVFFIAFASIALGQADEKQAALDAIGKAEYVINGMEQLGFPANRANDTLNEARLLFSREYYKAAESLANDVEGIKERAISINKRIDETEAHIYEATSLGIDVSGPKSLFDQAISSFRNEDYERAEELLSQAVAKMEELETEQSMKRAAEGKGWEGFLRIVRENIAVIMILAAAGIACGFGIRRYRKRKKLLKKISKLNKERESLENMIKGLQVKYFGQGNMSKSEYESLMARYRKKLAVIKRRKLVSEGLLKPGNKKD
ncbi:MAG: hypothetical protein NTY20_05445 [Candidatus Aenigmarchaeota archaeon]|nr:hypothetical protein [Candidatus Aenigmarchaeota archaeon]